MPRTSAARRSRSVGAPAEAAREIAELRARLADESKIGPAVGLLAAILGADPAAAREHLVALADAYEAPIGEVASAVVAATTSTFPPASISPAPIRPASISPAPIGATPSVTPGPPAGPDPPGAGFDPATFQSGRYLLAPGEAGDAALREGDATTPDRPDRAALTASPALDPAAARTAIPAAAPAPDPAADPGAAVDPTSTSTPAEAEGAPLPRTGRGMPGTVEVNTLAMTLRTRLGAVVGPAAVALFALDGDGFLRLHGTAGIPPGVATAWWNLPPHLTTPAVAAVARGRPFWLPDLAKTRRRYVLIGEPDVVWPSRAWLPIRDGNRIIGVAGVLCAQPQAFDPRVRRTVTRYVAEATPALLRLLGTYPERDRWAADAQAILDRLPGAVCVAVPVPDHDGRIVDFQVVAASPGVVGVGGQRGRDVLGLGAGEALPAPAGGALIGAFEQVLATGRAREIGPFPCIDRRDGLPASSVCTVRAHRLGAGLLVSWERAEGDRRFASRLALIERLGGLGWAEWDLATDTVNWSDQLLAIFGRGPGEGPARLDDLPCLVVPEDMAGLERATAGLLTGGKPMDVRFRIRVRTGVRHVRAVFETANDGAGRPVRVYGIVQDMTAHEAAERIQHRLIGVERELADRQRVQRAEHRMVAALQQIILPLPSRPIDRPGLRVAVRYQPAEELALVGGDWYDVVALPAGRTLLAVGDVAGHGIAAAATMARLRHALAALAVTTSDPAELLGYLNRIVCDDPAEPTATVVVGRYDPQTRVLAWAQAGHPPPILISDGTATALRRPPGVLVGARREAVYAGAEVWLPPGSRLLLYTDGLIERRGRTDADWLAPILDTLATAEAEPVDALLAHLRPANPDDDLCVLGLDLPPAV